MPKANRLWLTMEVVGTELSEEAPQTEDVVSEDTATKETEA